MPDFENHIPKASIPQISKWISNLDILIKIKKRRSTKLGDFRVNKEGKYLISINEDLNNYAFLITLTHEIAHAFVWEKYKRKAMPHGNEWKMTFKSMMLNFLSPDYFPEDILKALSNHLKNPKASTANDYNLSSILRKYDKVSTLTITDVPNGSTFATENGRKFIKIEKLRKRYKCKAIDSERIYLFNPLAIIESI